MALDEDIKKLRKLKPRDRIKKLREIKQAQQDTMDEIASLILDSEKEIVEKVKDPDVRESETQVDISLKFEDEDFSEQASPLADEIASVPQYIQIKQAYSDYVALKDMEYSSISGQISKDQLENLDQIGRRLDRTKYSGTSDEVTSLVVASFVSVYRIRKYAGLD